MAVFQGLLFLLLVFFTLVVYWPGLKGPFLLDDFVSLQALGQFGGVRNWETFQLYAFSNHSGPGGRFLSAVSFLIDDTAWPSDPFSFKYTNLLLHLLTGVLLTWLIYRFTWWCDSQRRMERAVTIALLTAAMWLLHPFHVSTTLYVVQRMAILSALFSVLGLLLYVVGREQLAHQTRRGYLWMTLGVVLCTPLAFFSKENGALLPLLILILEYTLLRHADSPRPASTWLLIFLGLPNFLMIGYFVTHWGGVLEGYESRPFTLMERLFTESRIVGRYVYDLLMPKLATSGVFKENIAVSHGWLDPPVTLAAVLAIVAAVLGAGWGRIRYPSLSLAILFFLAGHLLESTFIPLELYFEHRNYLPSVFLFLPLTQGLVEYGANRQWLKPVAWVLISLLAFLTYQQALLWGNPQQLALYWAQKNPDSIRAQRALAIEWESHGQPALALQQVENALKLFPDHVELWLHRTVLHCRYARVDSVEFANLERISRMGFYDVRAYSLAEALVTRLVDHHCPGALATYAHFWLDGLLENQAVRTNQGAKGQIDHLQGLVSLGEGQATLALEHFQKSQHNRPDTETGLLQVSLLANHGLFAEALQLLALVRDGFQNHRQSLSYYQKSMDFASEITRLEKLLLADQADQSDQKKIGHSETP